MLKMLIIIISIKNITILSLPCYQRIYIIDQDVSGWLQWNVGNYNNDTAWTALHVPVQNFIAAVSVFNGLVYICILTCMDAWFNDYYQKTSSKAHLEFGILSKRHAKQLYYFLSKIKRHPADRCYVYNLYHFVCYL